MLVISNRTMLLFALSVVTTWITMMFRAISDHRNEGWAIEVQMPDNTRYYGLAKSTTPTRFPRISKWFKHVNTYYHSKTKDVTSFLINATSELKSRVEPPMCKVVSNEYCRKYSSKHTMCRFPEPGAVPAFLGERGQCKARLYAGMDPGLTKLIVHWHNVMRNMVASGAESRGNPGPQPPAADMMRLEWNNELALIAQRWAENCYNSSEPHDRDRRLLSHDWSKVSQNVFWSFNESLDAFGDDSKLWQRVIQVWMDEVEDFSNIQVGNFQRNPGTGHYTTVVWSQTTAVGCGQGIFICTNPRTNKYGYCFKFVCNYGPGGNLPGKAIYHDGEPGSRCPQDKSTLYPNLCSINS